VNSAMKALLLIAHESRREASNEEVMALAKRIQINSPGHFEMVVPAFLALAEPSIPEAIE
jgi:sirohydrochlorin ferrochelatase